MKRYVLPEYMTGDDIRTLRAKFGLTQKELAGLINVSQKTIERWEYDGQKITGPAVAYVKILREYPQIANNLALPEKEYPLRLWYMFRQDVCTVIDVDERRRLVKIKNYTNHPIKKAFGPIENPTFEDYQFFLESRCIPRTRDKMKLALKELDVPFYDPYLIIEKTQGRMAEDDFWIRIER